MQSNLSQVYQIQKFLNSINYPDAYRLSREIAEYLSINKEQSVEQIISQLKQNKPWEYICGYTEFCKNRFKVTEDTMIPRIETEQLVYECRDLINQEGICNVLDIGTGCGCIAISLAYYTENTNIIATDISQRALEVAKENEKNILTKKQITWYKTDLIDSIQRLDTPTLLIANLPYIPTKLYEKLDDSVLLYEPKIALKGGDDGLHYYRELLKQLTKKEFTPKGIYIETESSVFSNTKKLVKQYLPNSKVKSIKDCFNRNRFLYISF